MFAGTTLDPPPLAAVESALAAILEVLDPSVLSGPDAQEALGRFARIANMATHGARLMGKRVDETNAWKARGHRSAAESMADALGCTAAEAARELGTARKLDGLEATDRAARRGELSPSKTGHVADAGAVDPTAEADLLDLAAKGSASEVRDEARRRRHAAAGDDRQRHRRIRRTRFLRQWTDDEGASRLMWGDVPEHGAEVGAILDPYIDQRFDQARRLGLRDLRERYAADAFLDALRDAAAFRRGESVHDAPAADPAQAAGVAAAAPAARARRAGTPADAAAARADRAGTPAPSSTPSRDDQAPASDPVADGVAPTDPGGTVPAERTDRTRNHPSTHAPSGATVTGRSPVPARAGEPPPVSTEAADPRPRGPSEDDPLPAPTGWRTPARRGADAKVIVRIDHAALIRGHTEPGEVCEIAGVGPVPVASVVELMDDAFLAAVVMKGTDVVNVAHLGRSPNAVQRTAIQAQPRRCTTLGCARTERLENDHADPWVDTHVTRLDGLDPSCEHYHDRKTYEGHRHTPGRGPRPLLSPAEQVVWNREHPDDPIAPIDPPGRRGPTRRSRPDDRPTSSAPRAPTVEPLTLDLDDDPPGSERQAS